MNKRWFAIILKKNPKFYKNRYSRKKVLPQEGKALPRKNLSSADSSGRWKIWLFRESPRKNHLPREGNGTSLTHAEEASSAGIQSVTFPSRGRWFFRGIPRKCHIFHLPLESAEETIFRPTSNGTQTRAEETNLPRKKARLQPRATKTMKNQTRPNISSTLWPSKAIKGEK